MKKVLSIVLVFVVILAALLGVSALVERNRPVVEESEEQTKEQKTISNALDISSAATIMLADGGASVSGLGAEVNEGRVVIRYPGTYIIQGTLEDGQIYVDLGDFNGAAYLVMNGASITCSDGPAIHVVQADLAAIYLVEGTQNYLRDGADYLIREGQESKTGAGIYSADDLLIYGDGALTVTGTSADGIRSKDALIIAGGDLTVYAAQDGLQGSDLIDIYGGSMDLHCNDDGITTTEGTVTFYGGSVSVACVGDGVNAMGDLVIEDGTISVVAYAGAENFAAIALEDVSAKGMKAQNITISGGDITLDTADDGLHAARDISITGGSFSISSGDDAIHAANELEVLGVTVDITRSYEGLEADTVRVIGSTVTAAAENNGVDAGDGGFTGESSWVELAAPRGVSSDTSLTLRGSVLTLNADGTDSLFSCTAATLENSTILACAETGYSSVLLEKCDIPGSLLYVFPEAIPAGTEIVLSDAAGGTVFSFTRDTDLTSVYIAGTGAGLTDGTTYVLTAGDSSLEAVFDGASGVVNEPEIAASQEMRPGPGGMFGGMFAGRP